MALNGVIHRRGAVIALSVVVIAMLGGAVAAYVTQGDSVSLANDPDLASWYPSCPRGSAVQSMISDVAPPDGPADWSSTPEAALKASRAEFEMAYPEYPIVGFYRVGARNDYINFGYRVGNQLRAVISVGQYGEGWTMRSYRACVGPSAGVHVVPPSE